MVERSGGIIARLIRRLRGIPPPLSTSTNYLVSSQTQPQLQQLQAQQKRLQQEDEEWKQAYNWYRKGKPSYAAQGSSWYGKYLKIVKGEKRPSSAKFLELTKDIEENYPELKERARIQQEYLEKIKPFEKLTAEILEKRPELAEIQAREQRALATQQKLQELTKQIEKKKEQTIFQKILGKIRYERPPRKLYGEEIISFAKTHEDPISYFRKLMGKEPKLTFQEQKKLEEPRFSIESAIWKPSIFISRQLEKVYPFEKGKDFLFKEREIPLEIYRLPSSLIKFKFFSPFMSSAGAKKGKTTKQKAEIIKKMKEKDAKKLIKMIEEAYKKGNLKENVKVLENIIKNEPNIENKKIMIENLKKLLDNAMDKGFLHLYSIDEAGNVQIFTKTGTITPESFEGLKQIELSRLPELEASVYAGLGRYERTSQSAEVERARVEYILGRDLFKSKDNAGLIEFEGQFSSERPLQSSFQASSSLLKSSQSTKTEQIQRQIARQEQQLRQKTGQASMLGLSSLQSQQQQLRQFQRQQQRLRQRGRGKGKIKIWEPKIRKPFLIFDDDFTKRKRKGRRRQGRKDFFLGEIRRFGVWKPVFKGKDFLKVEEATRRKIARSLGASYRIRSSGGLRFPTPSPFFRPSKREPGVLIEKRKYRLSSPGEKKEIQFFRRIKGKTIPKW